MSQVRVAISLGTSHAKVAFFPKKVITTKIYFGLTNEADRLIVSTNKMNKMVNPEVLGYDVMRLIGRKSDESSVEEDMRHYPHKVKIEDGRPKIVVEFKERQKTFFPEEILAIVIMKMKHIAELYLMKPVSDAVITVPSSFNDRQQKATKKAGAISGLNISQFINEPIAAAIAYEFNKIADKKLNVMIFDFGGGTLKVFILSIHNGMIEEKSTAANGHLGGNDFNMKIFDHFVHKFERKHKTHIPESDVQQFRTQCEVVKKALSFRPDAYLNVYMCGDINFHTTIKRIKFEDLNEDLFQSTLKYVKKALDAATLDKNDIDEIVLVGGSTNIPKIQEILKEFFNGKELTISENPVEVIAYGAAVIADGYVMSENNTLIPRTAYGVAVPPWPGELHPIDQALDLDANGDEESSRIG